MRKQVTYKALNGKKVFAKVQVTMNDGTYYVEEIQMGIEKLLTKHYLNVMKGKTIVERKGRNRA